MKAILIDTVNRQVLKVNLPNPKEVGQGASNRAIYEWLGEGTELMQSAAYLEKNDVVFVDEEGLFNKKIGCFTFDDSHPLRGNGIICGGNDEGGSEDVKITVDEVRERIRFGRLVPKL